MKTTSHNQTIQTVLAELISFPTVTGDQSSMTDCLELVRQWAIDRGWHTRNIASGGFDNLVISSHPGKEFKVILLAHMDVVPAYKEQFTLLRQDGKLYGRGVYDMKFAAACYMVLLDELQAQRDDLDIAVLITTDEETDGSHGTKILMEDGYRGDVAILPDGGDNWRIEETAKGVWSIRLTANGKNAHGSRPWEGDNAVERLMKVLQSVMALNQNTPTGVTTVVSSIHGGEAVNQVPHYAMATVDIRFRTLQEHEENKRKIQQIAAAGNCEIEPVLYIDPMLSDLNGQYHVRFARIIADVLGKPLHHAGVANSLGASDARFLAQCGIPVIISRPVGGGQHSDEEWIDEDSLYDYYQVVRQFVLESASIEEIPEVASVVELAEPESATINT